MRRLRMVKLCSFLGAMVLLVAVLEASAAAPKLEKTKLKLGVSVPSVAFLPVYVALEEKLFQQEGLEVELLAFRSGTDNTQALLARSIDLIAGAFPESVLIPRSQGADIKTFYGLCNLPVYKWYSKPEIKAVKEIKGKKIAVSKIGSQSDVMTRWVVRKAGLDSEKDVQIIQCGGPMDRLSALMSGAVDAAVLSDPGSFMAEKKGYNLLLSLDQFVKGYPNETYNATPQFLRENPETVKAFIRANNKAIELLRSDEKKALAVIAKYVKVTGEDALQAYRSYRDSYPIDGSPPLDGIELLQEICVGSGDIKQKMPENDIIDYTYIKMFRK